MKMLKKVTAVFVVLLLVLGTMSIGAYATGETGTIGITITPNKAANLYPGDIVTFTVNISTDFRYIAMRWPVMYTLKAFEPVIANDGEGDTDYGNVTGHGTLESVDSYLESAEASTNEPFGGTYSRANYGCLLIQWTGGTTGNGVTNYYEPNGANCLTFQLRVKPGYTSNKGIATVAIPTTAQAKSMFYYEGITDPTDGNSTFRLTTATCTINSDPATVSIIKEPAGLEPAAGTSTIIDMDPNSPVHYIYGLNGAIINNELIDETNILDYVNPTGNATFTLVPNDFGLISTGAKLLLYDAVGTYLDEFTFVIFGDINGDAVFDSTDCTMLTDGYLFVEDWAQGDLKDNATFFACDINGDGEIMSDDFGPLMEAIGLLGYINQINDPDDFFVYYNPQQH